MFKLQTADLSYSMLSAPTGSPLRDLCSGTAGPRRRSCCSAAVSGPTARSAGGPRRSPRRSRTCRIRTSTFHSPVVREFWSWMGLTTVCFETEAFRCQLTNSGRKWYGGLISVAKSRILGRKWNTADGQEGGLAVSPIDRVAARGPHLASKFDKKLAIMLADATNCC